MIPPPQLQAQLNKAKKKVGNKNKLSMRVDLPSV